MLFYLDVRICAVTVNLSGSRLHIEKGRPLLAAPILVLLFLN